MESAHVPRTSPCAHGGPFCDGTEIQLDQLPDALNREVGCRKAADDLLIQRVVPLARENGRHPAAPDLFDRSEDAYLVVDENTVICRVAPRDVLLLELLVDVDEHGAVECVVQAGAPHLVRLEHDIAVRKDDVLPELPRTPHRIEGVRVQALGKRVFQEEVRKGEQVWIGGEVGTVELQSAEVIGVPDPSALSPWDGQRGPRVGLLLDVKYLDIKLYR